MSLKQGLSYLIEQARKRGYRTQYDQKAIIIPIFSFINQLIASIKGFLNSREYECWCAYFLDHHLYDRTLPNMIKSWQKLKETSLECHLLQTLLTVRNRNKLRLYLKVRKQILQTAAENAMLDEVLLDLQDSIAIIHKIFTNEEIRKALIQGIKNIFLAFKISQAKLYSSVLIEYLLAVYDSIIQIETEEATISGQFSTNKSASRPFNQNYQELFSSISNFQSTIHNENGLYKKSNFSHSHSTQKKYQIIEKKFLPLKQTAQYISNSQPHKFSSNSKHKNQHSNDKSHFYDFISNKNQVQEYVSQKSKALKIQPSNFSQSRDENSYQKQQKFYRKLHMQPSRDRSSSPSPQPRKQVSRQRKSVSPQPVSSFIKKQPQIKPVQGEPSKNFSLGWFSDKLFETDNEQPARQSFLRKSRQKILQKAEEKRRQSTEKYEIENHFINSSLQRIHDSKLQKDYAAESDKSEQFEKMVSKNQEFKEKMLKKSHIETGSGSENDINSKERMNSRAKIFGNENQENGNNFSRIKFDQENEGVVQFTSNFGPAHRKETSGNAKIQSNSPQKDISSDSIRRMKKRNEMILNGLQDQQYYEYGQKSRNQQQQQEEQQEVYSFKKAKSKIKNNQQFVQKPQIIHKSIGEKKMAYFSKYSNNQTQNFLQNNTVFGDQPQDQRSSYQMGKMKSLLRIIDDYRQNAVQNDKDDKQLEISQSFCKKSRFQSQKEMDSIQQHSYDGA